LATPSEIKKDPTAVAQSSTPLIMLPQRIVKTARSSDHVAIDHAPVSSEPAPSLPRASGGVA